jgi:hypothetical protein
MSNICLRQDNKSVSELYGQIFYIYGPGEFYLRFDRYFQKYAGY